MLIELPSVYLLHEVVLLCLRFLVVLVLVGDVIHTSFYRVLGSILVEFLGADEAAGRVQVGVTLLLGFLGVRAAKTLVNDP